ncbi:MAG TPA: Gfo/Idh/MocA family oxidoreductase [Armatimonadota bacterium]|jgi:hypothetical protein
MIRIGVVNIDTSHPLAFSAYFRQGDRARYAAVYNDSFRGDEEVEAFIRNHGLDKRCATIEELADSVDVGFIQGVNWDKHVEQAQPFIDRGKPVFIDKPIVGNIADCGKVEALAAAGAVILGSSSLRYVKETTDFLAIPVEERGEIVNVYATSGVNDFDYAIHAAETIGGLLGPGAVSVTCCGCGEVGGARSETYFVRLDSGQSAVYNLCIGVWQPFEVVITTTKSTYQYCVDTGIIYHPMLDLVCDAVKTGAPFIVPVPDITESVKILLAGRISRERGGATVALAEIPDDDPGFDGAAFQDHYAAKTTKMYLR